VLANAPPTDACPRLVAGKYFRLFVLTFPAQVLRSVGTTAEKVEKELARIRQQYNLPVPWASYSYRTPS